MEEVKENKNVFHHFAIFAIVNELLIINLAYCLMQAHDEMRLAIEVARRMESCLLQVTMATHKRRITLDPRSELL